MLPTCLPPTFLPSSNISGVTSINKQIYLPTHLSVYLGVIINFFHSSGQKAWIDPNFMSDIICGDESYGLNPDTNGSLHSGRAWSLQDWRSCIKFGSEMKNMLVVFFAIFAQDQGI